jgi:hypothetical protein
MIRSLMGQTLASADRDEAKTVPTAPAPGSF